MKKEIIKNWEILFRAVFVVSGQEFVYDIFRSLPPREQKILSLRFGLQDGISRDLETVGKEFGVTREGIRQIEVRALEQLRKLLKINQNKKSEPTGLILTKQT